VGHELSIGIRAQGKKQELMERIVAHRSKSSKQQRLHECDDGGQVPNKRQKTSSSADGWTTELVKVFSTYEDHEHNEGCMSEDGILSLCDTIGVDAQDPCMLVLSFHMNAKTMGEYSKDEFIAGMKALSCHSMDDLKAKVPLLRQQLHDAVLFPKIYAVIKSKHT
jgi:DCN1-like protein 1/2